MMHTSQIKEIGLRVRHVAVYTHARSGECGISHEMARNVWPTMCDTSTQKQRDAKSSELKVKLTFIDGKWRIGAGACKVESGGNDGNGGDDDDSSTVDCATAPPRPRNSGLATRPSLSSASLL